MFEFGVGSWGAIFWCLPLLLISTPATRFFFFFVNMLFSPGGQALILIQKDAVPIPWNEDVRSSGNRNLRIQPSRAELP